MTKILSQAGNSLADIYDVEGSIAGIEQLETQELPIVHEMAATIFSERLAGEIVRLDTGALAQNVAWDVILTSPPVGIYRVLGMIVLVDVVARVLLAQTSLRDPGTGREVPFFVWDTNGAGDFESTVRIVDNGQSVANVTMLRGTTGPDLPTVGIAEGQPRRVGEEIVFRGQTRGFGAGTVTTTALVYLASGEVAQGALSSRGLPVPSW